MPWLDETLWWVPRGEHVAKLVKEGVARGRIWTARELADLARVDGAVTDIPRIARLKQALGLEIMEVVRDPEAADV